jgi:hypothetical protein
MRMTPDPENRPFPAIAAIEAAVSAFLQKAIEWGLGVRLPEIL